MGLKIYKSASGQVIAGYIKVDDKNVFLCLNNFDKTFRTDDEKLQKGIENSPFFKDGRIIISYSDGVKNKSENFQEQKNEPKEFPEVTDINDAISLLRKEPYKIPVSKLKDRESLLKIAGDCNVLFPNLK